MIRFLEKILNGIVWMNIYVFEPLNNGDVRMDAFIGIVGAVVAIIIFVAETMKDNNVETQKKFILEKTKIKESMIFSVTTLILCILKLLIPYSKCCPNTVTVKVIYFLSEVCLNFLIGISIYSTIRLFIISIRLNVDSKYFYEEYYNYIRNKLKNIHNNKLKCTNKKVKTDSLKKFLEANNEFFTIDNTKLEDYISVKSDKNGIFKEYSPRVLQMVVDKLEENKIHNSKLIINKEPIIILPLTANDKINNGTTVAYYKRYIGDFSELLNSAVLLNDYIPYQDDEINLIIENLFFLASNRQEGFDGDNRLFNCFNYLYKNNMYAILNMFYEYIRKFYIFSYNDLHKNEGLVKFLNKLANLAYINNDFEKYKFSNDYIYYCYKEQLNISNNLRKVSYNFTNNILKYEYYSVKKNNDSIYYDALLSNLLKFIFDLIIKKEFDAINDIFQNIIFDFNYCIDREPDEYDVRKLQFSYGIVHGLIILYKKNYFQLEDKEGLNMLIGQIKRFFVNIYSQNEAILYFNRYYTKTSNISDVYLKFDLYFADREYKNSFSGYIIDKSTILKEYIYLFDIKNLKDFSNNSEMINKDNKWFYQRLLKAIENDDSKQLSEFLNKKIDSSNLIDLVNKLINQCKNEEVKYNQSHELSKTKIDDFKKSIFTEYDTLNELLNYLKENGKYSIENVKGEKVFGIYQLIERNIFFENFDGIKNISKEYAQALKDGITKYYLKELDNVSSVITIENINNDNKFRERDGFIIITNPYYAESLKEIEGIKIITIPVAKDIYIIKSTDLPNIKMLKPDIEQSAAIRNNIYCQLIDCSKNESERKKIIENNAWLSEERNEEEQIEYLKSNCVLKLFASPSIIISPTSKCYKIKIGEEIE